MRELDSKLARMLAMMAVARVILARAIHIVKTK